MGCDVRPSRTGSLKLSVLVWYLQGSGMVMVLLVTVTSKPDSCASAVNGTFTETAASLSASSGLQELFKRALKEADRATVITQPAPELREPLPWQQQSPSS